jgi:hypothetical protein
VTRRFEDQPEFDEVNENFRVWRIPFGSKKFIRKEDMHDHIGDFVTNCLTAVGNRGSYYSVVYSHYWDAGWAGQEIAEELGIPHLYPRLAHKLSVEGSRFARRNFAGRVLPNGSWPSLTGCKW